MSNMSPVFQWKTPTKIIAITDLVLAIITIILLGFTCLVLVFGKEILEEEIERQGSLDDPDTKLELEYFLKGSTGLVVATCGIWILCEVVVAIAAFKAIGATKVGIPPGKAIDRTKGYRIVTVIVLVISILGVIRGGGSAAMGLNFGGILFRSVAIVLVSAYLKELIEAEADLHRDKDYVDDGHY